MAGPAANAGGGAASDNATILRWPIERNIGRTAVGPIWDPIAVWPRRPLSSWPSLCRLNVVAGTNPATMHRIHPRPRNGIFVAMMVTNWTLDSSGRLDMNKIC